MSKIQGQPLYAPSEFGHFGENPWKFTPNNVAAFNREMTEGMGRTRSMATKMAENLIGPKGPIAQSKWPGHKGRKSPKARKSRKQSRKQRR
jgi:hypothetical protein